MRLCEADAKLAAKAELKAARMQSLPVNSPYRALETST